MYRSEEEKNAKSHIALIYSFVSVLMDVIFNIFSSESTYELVTVLLLIANHLTSCFHAYQYVSVF